MRRKPEAVLDDVRVIQRNLTRFDLATLSAMQRIDRFDATDTGSGSSGPKPKHAVSDPVGARVVAKLSGQRVSDPVGAATKEIERELFNMRRRSETLVQQLDFVLNPRERHRDNYIAHCEACRREVACTSSDRLRSGFCYQCYRKWLGLNKPNRVQFCLLIQEQADADAKV